MRILIIEDNIELSLSVKESLEKEGLYVDAAYNGQDGEEKVDTNAYDCILLDLNLPDLDGLLILKNLRESGKDVPVIIMTARDEIEERAKGLNLGADDYVTKPFHLVELRARIGAAIRRYYGKTTPVIQIGGLLINPLTRKASVQGKEVELLAKEFDILEYLAEKYPAVVSAEELVEHVYDEEFDPFSSVLRVHISRLRRKLTKSLGYEMIQTMRGKGYYLCEK